MPILFDIPIDRLAEADLQTLVSSGEREGDHLDAKAGMYGTGMNHEFLKDVTAFANARAGHLLIGASEQDGVITALPGVQGNADAELRRLEQILQRGLNKTVAGLRTHAVPLAAGGHVLVVRVPLSYDAPHQIVSGGSEKCDHHHKIFIRTGRLIEQANVEQIRGMMARGPELLERVDRLRQGRVEAIARGKAPCPLSAASALVLHVVPLATFDSAPISVRAMGAEKPRLVPPALGGYSYRVNQDGLLAFVNPIGDICTAYAQLHRTGMIEAVRCDIRFRPDGGRYDRVQAADVEQNVVRVLTTSINMLRALDVEPPFAVYASLIGVSGAVYTPWGDFENAVTFPPGHVLAARHILHEIPPERQLRPALQPIFDELANAAGHAVSPVGRATY